MTQSRLDIVPLTLPQANRVVSQWHRHHAPIPGGFGWFCCGAVAMGVVVGCAIAGRPTNRNNDDGQTVEVLRLATNGQANACSALLGACARAAKAVGARRILTYTLTTETGVSLRGAGWTLEDEDTGKSWWGSNGSRVAAIEREHFAVGKRRWGLVFRDRVEYQMPQDTASDTQGVLAL